MTRVVLVSGGMDSFIASKLYEPDINLHIDFNEKWSAKQRRILPTLNIPNLVIKEGLDLSEHIADDGVYLPNRNVLMITLAQLYGDDIILSSTAGAVHPDKNSTFAVHMEALLTYVHKRDIKVLRPFGMMTKYDIVKEYLDAGYSIEQLYKTTSCYSPDKIECNNCRSCLRRLVAFAQHGYRVNEIGLHKTKIRTLLAQKKWSANPIENKLTKQFLDELQ